MRWEWRTFGEELGGAEERLGSMEPERVLESDEAYDLAALADAAEGAIRVVPVHKRRRRLTIGGCMAELTDISTGERSTRTIAIEAEDPERVIAAVRELGLGSRPNVNVPRGLRALI